MIMIYIYNDFYNKKHNPDKNNSNNQEKEMGKEDRDKEEDKYDKERPMRSIQGESEEGVDVPAQEGGGER